MGISDILNPKMRLKKIENKDNNNFRKNFRNYY